VQSVGVVIHIKQQNCYVDVGVLCQLN